MALKTSKAKKRSVGSRGGKKKAAVEARHALPRSRRHVLQQEEPEQEEETINRLRGLEPRKKLGRPRARAFAPEEEVRRRMTKEEEHPEPEPEAKGEDEPTAEELAQEEVTVASAREAGAVPRDEDAFAAPRERGGYDADTAIKLYLREIGQVKLLTPQEEIDLAAKIKKGDKKAREDMIKANLRLVVKIAHDYEGFGFPLLDLISDPNVAYILMIVGFYGILFELYSPGAIFPGVMGVICLILAFYSMHTLPVNYAGLALIIVAIILFILEIKIISHGLLGIGGVIALVLGSMMLIRSDSALEFIRISWSVIISTTVATAAFFFFLIALAVKGQKAKPVTGTEGMIGEEGETLARLEPSGMVRVHGELWKAESVSGIIETGRRIRREKLQHVS